MTQYIMGFAFYTLGVIGLLLIAYVVAKNYMNGGFLQNKKKSNLTIEESLSLAPRKTLYIIKVYDEKYLISSDSDKTTMLAKIGEEKKQELVQEEHKSEKEFKNPHNSVILSMLEKLNNDN
ncbi:MAG: flagellar biosynthetic protein FliO [Candidatus Gastranaerophilales bacterium]|nr:flagellar biosynthetic protein FliO [Candidatus Gastranaerophilales bacterium]